MSGWRLTRRGERLAAALMLALILTGLGFVGWIETGLV